MSRKPRSSRTSLTKYEMPLQLQPPPRPSNSPCSQTRTITPDTISWTNLALALSDNNKDAAAERCQRLALGLHINEDPRQLLWCSGVSQEASRQRHLLLQNLAVQQLRRDPWKLSHWQLLEARLGVIPGAWKTVAKPQHYLKSYGEARLWTSCSYDEQGYGDDAVIRWLPLLLPRCKQLTLLLRPSLISLVKAWLRENNNEHNVSLEKLVDDGPRPWERDVAHCPLLSLPVALELDGIEEISTTQDSDKVQPTALPEKGRIGWSGQLVIKKTQMHKAEASNGAFRQRHLYRF